MAAPSNVFRGPNSLADFFDPDKNPPLPLVEIPDRLNPHREDGVRIYAKVLTHLPAQNVKSLPALNMLRAMPEAKNKRIVEASSGSTALSLGMIARVLWGHEDVNAYVTNKKHPDSLNLIRFFGITPHLYAGLTQQEPTDETGVMCRLRRLAEKRDDIAYPGQYDNNNNWKAHERWTGPQILTQLPEISLFATTVGTGGCITGTASHLKSQKPSCRTLGVFNVFGDETPGPRNFEGFHTCGFPWGELMDASVDVASVDSYRMSMLLSREGLICGPSSGQALQGILDYIRQLRKAGGLGQLADATTGEVSCVFTLSDLPYQYLPQYFEKLGEAAEMLQTKPDLVPLPSLTADQPHAITQAVNCNSTYSSFWSSLRSCIDRLVSYASPADTNPSWQACCPLHLHQQAPFDPISTSTSTATTATSTQPLILDLRSKAAFRSHHLPGSLNMPLPRLTPGLAGRDFFGDPEAVPMIENAIQTLFFATPQERGFVARVRQSQRGVLVLCYDGGASQLATSTLRSHGVEAYCVKRGFGGLAGLVGC
ncbi:cysteine synthase [Lasiosphaeria hispida]|uniref:Cysteine synthase n=1 Tax=Lasiosphaeria hispida TaxID=260671 RepID=A0AAJ0MAA9_9PEZI|nr:cysteine synthase [Lasiosphaeria hispida]